jgi:superfamily II DNA or RNA helicase
LSDMETRRENQTQPLGGIGAGVSMLVDGRLGAAREAAESRNKIADGLRDYQVAAIERVRELVRAKRLRPVVMAPTGAGKTHLAAEIIRLARERGKRVAFCVPALSLIDQTVEMFSASGIGDFGVVQADHPLTDWSRPVQICSIQTLQRRKYPKVDGVIVDECHVRSKFLEHWIHHPEWKHVPFIGLSATPWSKGLGTVFEDLVIAATTQQLIDKGYLTPFRVFAPYHPDLSNVKVVAGDYHEGQLSAKMNQGDLVADVVTTWKRCAENRPTFVFAVDCAHAKALQQRFIAAGVPCGYMDAFTPRQERNEIRDAFHRGELNAVANVGVLTIGIDWDVRCIVVARPTRSEILHCLDTETEILTSHGWKRRGEIAVGDSVPTMADIQTGRGQWARVLAIADRPMRPEESWVAYDAPRANFRVTDGHTMIFGRPNSSPTPSLQVAPAREMLRGAPGLLMPTAVEMAQSGLPLTDAELYFIGMMMTDGTWGRSQGSISQSERHPEILERIERCLSACGIGYSKSRVTAPNGQKDGKIVERHPRWVFTFSVGKPRAHGNTGRGPRATKRSYVKVDGVRGFGHLMPYLDKDVSPALMGLSKSQFAVLVTGIFDGDGFKISQCASVDWTPRSWTLCSARKIFVDRLQALAAINGYTGHLRSEQKGRTRPIYILTITPKAWRSVGGYGARRPQVRCEAPTQERVWCIETETGTVITRRRGKVTVMGNCQIVGRGLRTAPGKADLLVLDHSDNHLRLGFVTDIHHEHLDDGIARQKPKEKVEKLPKECPHCHALRPPGVAVCPECGFKPSPVSKIQHKAGELFELKLRGGTRACSNEHVKLPGGLVHLKEFHRQLRCFAITHGYKLGWAAHQFRRAVGHWPPREWDNLAVMEPVPAVANWIKGRQIAFAKRMATNG